MVFHYSFILWPEWLWNKRSHKFLNLTAETLHVPPQSSLCMTKTQVSFNPLMQAYMTFKKLAYCRETKTSAFQHTHCHHDTVTSLYLCWTGQTGRWTERCDVLQRKVFVWSDSTRRKHVHCSHHVRKDTQSLIIAVRLTSWGSDSNCSTDYQM